jgi:hypothetical protein
VTPFKIAKPQRAERRQDMGLQQLRVAPARLGLKFLRAHLEPPLGVLFKREVRIVD